VAITAIVGCLVIGMALFIGAVVLSLRIAVVLSGLR